MADLPRESKLGRLYNKYQSSTKYQLCSSDAEPLTMKELLDMADYECKALWDNLKLSYTEARGHHLLRKEVARLHNVDAEDVIVIAPQEGILIAMRCLVHLIRSKNNGKPFHAVSTYPGHQSLHEILRNLGVNLNYWTLDETNEGWNFDFEKLTEIITEDTKVLVVNFPHNPTGFTPSAETWTRLINLCQSQDIFLFSDEMYCYSNHDGSPPLESAAARYCNAISLGGLSKTFALPGLRIGWLVTKNQDLITLMCNFKEYTTICNSGPSEVLSIIALRNSDKLVSRTLRLVKNNLKLLEKFFEKYGELLEWHRPRAGTAGLVRLKGCLSKFNNNGATGLCEQLAIEKQLLLVPASVFGHADEYVRIGFARSDLPKCLSLLEDFIKENLP